VPVEIKFCGLMRPEDARYAAYLGASYVGVIFAGGPRVLTPDRAAAVLGDVPSSVLRVGVFGDQSEVEIAKVVDAVGLGVVQLHGGSTLERISRVRSVTSAAIWPVVRVTDALPRTLSPLLDAADGLLLDAYVPGALGGTGVSFAWSSIAQDLQAIRAGTRIILAGGLRPENVADAIAALAPDVVDVSSGVESAPGIKDHDRMRAFRDAVTHATIST
jgi:phosphoribosylanthranilate isomerase